MAHMQLMVEKQMKKSPQAEVVSVHILLKQVHEFQSVVDKCALKRFLPIMEKSICHLEIHSEIAF